jgi:hypothetical protein
MYRDGIDKVSLILLNTQVRKRLFDDQLLVQFQQDNEDGLFPSTITARVT